MIVYVAAFFVIELPRNIGVPTNSLNGVSIRKNVSCGSFYNMEAEKCTTLIHESSGFFTFRSRHFHFSLQHINNFLLMCCKSINEFMRTSNLSD